MTTHQGLKDQIIDWIGPTALGATPPLEEFIELGPEAIPVVIDIFSNPQDIQVVVEFGSDVYLPVLVALLNHYAMEGDTNAGHALFEIANSRILTWGKYGMEAHDLAYDLAQKISSSATGS